jgi:hypothetical protein
MRLPRRDLDLLGSYESDAGSRFIRRESSKFPFSLARVETVASLAPLSREGGDRESKTANRCVLEVSVIPVQGM